jgi:hypothetical protein
MILNNITSSVYQYNKVGKRSLVIFILADVWKIKPAVGYSMCAAYRDAWT